MASEVFLYHKSSGNIDTIKNVNCFIKKVQPLKINDFLNKAFLMRKKKSTMSKTAIKIVTKDKIFEKIYLYEISDSIIIKYPVKWIDATMD